MEKDKKEKGKRNRKVLKKQGSMCIYTHIERGEREGERERK